MISQVRLTFLAQAGRTTWVLAVCLLVTACTSLPKGEVSLDLGIKDRGVASWYGEAFHGKLTANGEVFDKTAYTAAHRKLPLGSIVRVMNLNTGKVVQVRITDRGPYVFGRMLDLSEAAAHELGMVEAGTAAVQLEVIGEHYVMPSLPRSQPSLASIVRRLDEAIHNHPFADGLGRPVAGARTIPQEVWYVRRERRLSGLLGSRDSTQKAVSRLINC